MTHKITIDHDKALNELKEFLAYKTVSTLKESDSEINACVNYLSSHLSRIGLNTDVIYGYGNPIIVADLVVNPNHKTVLIYGHYDVQPVDPESEWGNDPFSPIEKDGYLVARGASDNKGQIHAHIKSVEALITNYNGQPPVNLKIIIEGDEEIGSAHLDRFLTDHKEKLAANVAVVSDSAMLGLNQPTISVNLRGLLCAEIELQENSSDLHSGVHGGAVPNAIESLSKLISSLKDTDNRVLIPGFYDNIKPIPDLVARSIYDISRINDNYQLEVGASRLQGEVGFNHYEQRWYRPSLDINGIWGGFTGSGTKTVIPAKAFAKISIRLVDGQNPDNIYDQLYKYLNEQKVHRSTLTITKQSSGFPVGISSSSVYLKHAINALETHFNAPVKLVGEGGSIPIISLFQQILNVDTMLLGFGLPTDQIHAPNERFLINNYYNGIQSSYTFLNNIGSS